MTEFVYTKKGVRFFVRREGWCWRVQYRDRVGYCMTAWGVKRWIGKIV